MNSWEEDALFEQYGWYKNLVKRQYEAPTGFTVSFDDVVKLTAIEEHGEERLKAVIRRHGRQQG